MSQKRLEGRTAEVDAAGNVTEDAGVGVVGLQRLDLAVEVVRLLARGHAGVDGIEAAIATVGWLLWSGWFGTGVGVVVVSLNGLEIEEPMLSDPGSRQGHGVDVACASPFGKRFGGDTEAVSSDMGADPRLPVVGIHQQSR